jgi:hypothetical protein
MSSNINKLTPKEQARVINIRKVIDGIPIGLDHDTNKIEIKLAKKPVQAVISRRSRSGSPLSFGLRQKSR